MAMRYTIILAMAALAGCGGGAENDRQGAANPTAEAASGVTATVASADSGPGVATGDLPDFVELPKGARAITNIKMNDDSKAGGTLTLETRQAPTDLVAFYRASMARHGLKIALETNAEQMFQLMGESEDKTKTLMVTVLTDGEGGTTLNLVHSRPTS